MSTQQELVSAIKAELRADNVTNAELAEELGMSESSIKHIFARGDMPLSCIDGILGALKMDLADLRADDEHVQVHRGRELALAGLVFDEVVRAVVLTEHVDEEGHHAFEALAQREGRVDHENAAAR